VSKAWCASSTHQESTCSVRLTVLFVCPSLRTMGGSWWDDYYSSYYSSSYSATIEPRSYYSSSYYSGSYYSSSSYYSPTYYSSSSYYAPTYYSYGDDDDDRDDDGGTIEFGIVPPPALPLLLGAAFLLLWRLYASVRQEVDARRRSQYVDIPSGGGAQGVSLLSSQRLAVSTVKEEQPSKEGNRERRLRSNSMTLYHQTSPDVARKILTSQKMRRGKGGLAGGGIYFATSPSDTENKAHRHGTILAAEVHLGKVMRVDPNGESGITFTKLSKKGYDSVLIPRSGGAEYVVYNYDQVTSIHEVATPAMVV